MISEIADVVIASGRWSGSVSDAFGLAREIAIAIETRQGGDVKQAPSRSDESAGPKDIAQPSSSESH